MSRVAGAGWILMTGVLLLGRPHAAAGEEDVSSVARQARAAFVAKDTATLVSLAGARENDPWRVVDELVASGAPEAARAFAAACPDPDRDALLRIASAPAVADAANRRRLREAEGVAREGRLEEALRLLDAADATASPVLRFRLLLARARLAFERGGADAARARFEQALQRARDLGVALEWQEEALAARFEMLVAVGDASALLPLAEHRLLTLLMLGRDDEAAFAEANVAGIFVLEGMPWEALDHLERARGLLAALDVSADGASEDRDALLAQVDLTRIPALSLAGRAAEAVSLGERTVDHFLRTPDQPVEAAFAVEMLGNALSHAGDHEEALLRYSEALRLVGALESQDPRVEGTLRANRGNALLHLRRFEEAVEDLEAALPSLDADPASRAAALLNLAAAQRGLGRYEAAEATDRGVAALPGLPISLRALALLSLADSLSRDGTARGPEALDQALARVAEAEALIGPLRSPLLQVAASTSRAEVALARGDVPAATGAARTALSAVDSLTEGLADDEAVRARATGDRRRASRVALRAAAAAGGPALVFEMMERSRARAFLAAAGGRRGLLLSALPPDTVALERRLHARVAEAHHGVRRVLDQGGDRAALREASRRLDAAETDYGRILQRIQREGARAPQEGTSAVAALGGAQAALRPEEALVLTADVGDAAWALVVRPSGARIVPLALGSEVRADLAGLLFGRKDAPLEAIAAQEARLRKALVDPLALPKEVRRVLLSPDGAMAAAPWPLLVRGASDAGIALVPSASAWMALRRTPVPGGARRVLLGNPAYETKEGDAALRMYARGKPLASLPGTEREVRAAERPGDDVLLGPRATERALAEALRREGRVSVLHLGCHCILDVSRPRSTALALTPGEGEDGFLTVADVAQLPVAADLVVLSACSSGRGTAVAGEGLLGLVRAFMLAGARQVIASAWDVDDDATAALMSHLYRSPDALRDPARALRTAEEAVRAASDHPAWRHPAYWGAWVVWGGS